MCGLSPHLLHITALQAWSAIIALTPFSRVSIQVNLLSEIISMTLSVGGLEARGF